MESTQHRERPSAFAAVGAEPGTFRPVIRRGLLWKGSSQALSQVVRLIVTLVFARLLAPHDYGLVSMALVFSGVVFLFTDFALGTALVQRSQLSEEDRSTAFWCTVALGGMCSVAGLAAAGPVAAFYGEPRIRPLFAVLALGFFVSSLGATHGALLTRAMDFRSLEIAAMAGTVVGAIAGVAAAAGGAGPWAIVVQQLVTATVLVTMLWCFSTWRPRLVVSRASLRSLGGFSANLVGTRLCFYCFRNVDNLLVGRFLGAAPLGLYALAYTIALAPVGRVVDPIREVLFPVLARSQDDRARLAGVWLRTTALMAAFVVPAMLGLAIVAPDLVPTLLGARWRSAVPVVQILALVGALQSFTVLNSVVLPAIDRTSTLLRAAVATLALSVAGFAIGLHWGIVGVAVGYAAANVVIVPLYTGLTARALGTRLAAVAPAFLPGMTAAGLMVGAIVATRLLLEGFGLPAPSRAALVVVVGIVTIVFAWTRLVPELVRELGALGGRVTARTGERIAAKAATSL